MFRSRSQIYRPSFCTKSCRGHLKLWVLLQLQQLNPPEYPSRSIKTKRHLLCGLLCGNRRAGKHATNRMLFHVEWPKVPKILSNMKPLEALPLGVWRAGTSTSQTPLQSWMLVCDSFVEEPHIYTCSRVYVLIDPLWSTFAVGVRVRKFVQNWPPDLCGMLGSHLPWTSTMAVSVKDSWTQMGKTDVPGSY